MNIKRNGCSDPDMNKNEMEKRTSENQSNKMFSSMNFNGFNTSRGSFFNKDTIFQSKNDGMATSKLKLMNSDSPIKVKINKDYEKQNTELNLINQKIECNAIKMDINRNNSNNNDYKSCENPITDRKHSFGSAYDNSEEDNTSPKMNKYKLAQRTLNNYRQNRVSNPDLRINLDSSVDSENCGNKNQSTNNGPFANYASNNNMTARNSFVSTKNSINFNNDNNNNNYNLLNGSEASQINSSLKINKRSQSMCNEIYIKNETKENKEENSSPRKSLTFKLNFNENELIDINTKNKSDYIYNILYNSSNFNKLSNNDKKEFLMRPIDKGLWLRCKIERLKDKNSNKFIMTLSDTNTYIIGAFKRRRNTCSNYMIRVDQDLEEVKKDSGYIGKLKANFFGSEFNIYDAGKNPSKTKIKTEFRMNLGAVLYETSFFGSKGVRKMTIILPEVNDEREINKIIPTSSSDSLLKRYKKKTDNLIVFNNKQPEYSEKYKCFILNYKSRTIRQSIKNFQIYSKINETEEDLILQFGRFSDLSFILDFKYPFSIFQAFAVSLSSIDD